MIHLCMEICVRVWAYRYREGGEGGEGSREGVGRRGGPTTYMACVWVGSNWMQTVISKAKK